MEKVPENIFGFIQPKLAIFSTPNSEFNVLFDSMLPNGFRHNDHKFEWTRNEFQSWAQDICMKYPNYQVAFIGVGEAPPNNKNLGYATQIAIFARLDILDMPLKHEIVKQPTAKNVEYKTIYAVDFPFNKDTRTKQQKILDEANYYVNQSRHNELYFNSELHIYQLPWKNLMDYVKSVNGTETELLEILKSNKFNIEGDYIVLPEYDEDEDATDELDYDGEYNLEAEPYRYKLGDEEEQEISENLAFGCCVTAGNVNYDTEEDWD